MFLGHFGIGMAAKKLDERPSLGTIFLAAQFIDLLWPFFLLLNIERVEIDPGNTAFTPLNFVHYPYSHGLLSVLGWSVLFALCYYLLQKKLKPALMLGSVVFSHWILDLITHRPDLPLAPWIDYKAGLGLWNNITWTIILEGLIFIVGAFIYIRHTKAKKAAGNISLYSFLIFLVVIYMMNIIGDAPPSQQAIGLVGLSQWLLIAWGYWIDKTRTWSE